jgi:ferritin-like metal-binding protein YciE
MDDESSQRERDDESSQRETENESSKGETAASSEDHLLNHLRDVHAIEVHSIRQVERAARRRDEETQKVYESHLEESRTHDQKLKELVEAQGRETNAVEDKTLRGRSIGLRQLADIALDTPVKLAMNLFALEHLEIAAYELLAEVARATDEADVVRVAEEILEQERAAAEAIEGTFDRAVELLIEGLSEDDSTEDDSPEGNSSEESEDDSSEGEDGSSEEHEDSSEDELLVSHLRDVHALELQSLQLLRTAIEDVCEDEQLQKTYRGHLEQSEKHEELIAERLEAHEVKPSAVRDLHMSAAKTGLNELSANPPDAHAKMAMNLFCVEHLEIAGYELLIRIAERSDDGETVETARKILEEEREAAGAIQGGFARTVELMVDHDGSYESVRPGEVPAGQASDS